MKAIVKATGEIVDETAMVSTLGDDFYLRELEPVSDDTEFVDYWTRLKHQYAGMAMQGMLSNTSLMSMLFDATKDHDELLKEVIICSHEYAHALVEKLKEKEEKK